MLRECGERGKRLSARRFVGKAVKRRYAPLPVLRDRSLSYVRSGQTPMRDHSFSVIPMSVIASISLGAFFILIFILWFWRSSELQDVALQECILKYLMQNAKKKSAETEVEAVWIPSYICYSSCGRSCTSPIGQFSKMLGGIRVVLMWMSSSSRRFGKLGSR